jgi:queuine/archaeosine tRNA-ribosyltransferase
VNIGARSGFADFTTILHQNRRTIWLGQSVDTSILHTSCEDYSRIPILTSVGCVIRRPSAHKSKFDHRLRERLGAKGRLMVDSGGFVLMGRDNRGWGVGTVAALYSKIDADHLVSLDIPPNGRDTTDEREKKYKRTIANLKRLYDRFGERIVPVVHGAAYKEMERNCDAIRRFYQSPSLVGIGGLVPTIQRCGNARIPNSGSPQATICQAIVAVRRHFPKSKIHIFGVGSLHTALGVIAAGANSVDSIGWRQAAGYGSVFIPGSYRRLLTDRHRDSPCRPFVSEEDLGLLARCRCPACRSSGQRFDNVARLRASFHPRAIHNIWVLYGEVAGYLIARRNGCDHAYLTQRLSEAWLSVL